MRDSSDRLNEELRWLGETLPAAVAMPSVDAVIRRARTINRASTAAAAAVLTVGALGAVTAFSQFPASESADTVAVAIAPAPVVPAESMPESTPLPTAVPEPVASPAPIAVQKPRANTARPVSGQPRPTGGADG